MEIRRLLKTDALNASQIYTISWKTAYKGIVPQDFLNELPLERWKPFLESASYTSFVLIDAYQYMATSSVSQARDAHMDGWGEIISIYVMPEHFGKGYGRKLFSFVVDYLKQQGFDKIYLWVLEENKRARAFYERNGFTPTDGFLTVNIGGKELTEIKYIRCAP